jgi:hypothetical protein
MQGFVKLPAVLGQFEGSAHLSTLRTLLVRHKLASIPVRSDFLIAVVLGFLQLSPVGVENKLVVLIVRRIDFRILQGETQRTCGANQLLNLFVILYVLSPIASSPIGATTTASGVATATSGVATSRVTAAGVAAATSRVATTRITAVGVAAAVTTTCSSRILSLRARVIALVMI